MIRGLVFKMFVFTVYVATTFISTLSNIVAMLMIIIGKLCILAATVMFISDLWNKVPPNFFAIILAGVLGSLIYIAGEMFVVVIEAIKEWCRYYLYG